MQKKRVSVRKRGGKETAAEAASRNFHRRTGPWPLSYQLIRTSLSLGTIIGVTR